MDELTELMKAHKYSDAAKKATELISQHPSNYSLWAILGAAQSSLKQHDKAAQSFAEAIKCAPNFAPAYNNLGTALNKQEKHSEALNAFGQAIRLDPYYADAYYNQGIAFQEQKRYNDAVTSYHNTIQLNSAHAKAYINLGEAYREIQDFNNALRACQSAFKLQPGNPILSNNIGCIYRDVGDIKRSIEYFQNALKLQPNFIEALNNIGVSLHRKGDLEAAAAVFKKVINLNSKYVSGHYNLGNVYREFGKFELAYSSYSVAIKLNPNFTQAAAQLIHVRQHLCDFENDQQLDHQAHEFVKHDSSINPWIALSWVDNPKIQLSFAQKWADNFLETVETPSFARVKSKDEKIKIGYYSADFHNHAGMYLMSKMLASHNRELFEVYAFSYGPNYNDEMRKVVSNTVDHFFDIRDLSDPEICELSRNLQIDIALDRNGYTRNGRTGIFKYRVAPLQINFLGYPSTLGTRFTDYIVADHVTIPQKYNEFYSECIIYMPHTYQPTDGTRTIHSEHAMRIKNGLPENAFVLCCFNNGYKISSVEFTAWLRLLHRIPGSVLWLLKTNDTAVKNLKTFAQNHGIDPARLIFAEFMSHSHHLSRLCNADLFIDTFNYNAHTTTSDALYAGVPVVTKIGNQFSARVAASLLHAVGLSELVTQSEDEYEDLIFDLASTPEKLSLVKSKLQKNKLTEPLFDTQRYTRNFENALIQAYDLYRNGKRPRDIYVVD